MYAPNCRIEARSASNRAKCSYAVKPVPLNQRLQITCVLLELPVFGLDNKSALMVFDKEEWTTPYPCITGSGGEQRTTGTFSTRNGQLIVSDLPRFSQHRQLGGRLHATPSDSWWAVGPRRV